MSLTARRDFALALARETSAIILPYWNDPQLDVYEKGSPRDCVTEADYKAEAHLHERITSHYPEDGFIGEEGKQTETQSGITWAIDPLDGTVNFSQKIPHWCISIGCWDAEGSALGVIYDPLRNEMFDAVRGEGFRFQQQPASSRRLPDTLESSVWAFSVPFASSRSDTWFSQLRPNVGSVRWPGSLALDLAWCAMGRFHAFIHQCKLNPWDHAAGAVMCEEQGLEVIEIDPDEAGHQGLLVVPPEWRSELLALGIDIDQ